MSRCGSSTAANRAAGSGPTGSEVQTNWSGYSAWITPNENDEVGVVKLVDSLATAAIVTSAWGLRITTVLKPRIAPLCPVNSLSVSQPRP